MLDAAVLSPARPRVVFLGRPGPIALAFARSCAAQGIQVFLLDFSKPADAWRPFTGSLAGGRALPPSLHCTEDGFQRIVGYVRELGADALIAAEDETQRWLAARRTDFGSCTLMMPSAEALGLLRSKKSQIGLARAAGFGVLPTWYIDAPKDRFEIPAGDYPVVLRPSQDSTARPNFKVKLIPSPGEMATFLAGLELLGQPLIAQPFLHVPSLVVHAARAETGEFLAMRAFLAQRKFQGLSLTLKPWKMSRELETSCREFARSAGLCGCFHWDLLYSPEDGRAWFLEVNHRLGGTTDKVARFGYDEPALALAAFGVAPVPRPTAKSVPGRVANKREILKHIVVAAKGGCTALDYPGGSRLRHVLRSVRDLAVARDSVFSWNDLRGSKWFYLRGATDPAARGPFALARGRIGDLVRRMSVPRSEKG